MLNDPSLNLLRFPSRVGMLDAGLWRPALWALILGLVMGSALAVWQFRRHALLQAEHAALQARLHAQQRQQADLKEVQAFAQLQTRMRERAKAWQVQRQQFIELHARLSQEAPESGLRLQRWQGDGVKLSLQLWLPQAEGVTGLVARLSRASPQGWTLQHLTGLVDSPGVEAVLEAPWQPLPGGGQRR